MFIGNSNEYSTHAPNQQFNQLVGRLPNWQGRLGTGTAGGGVNTSVPQPNGANPLSGNPNVAMMIKALMAKSQ
jgi:hypothetical protein